MKYEDVATGKRYTGAALLRAGIPLPLTTGDYQEIRFVFKPVEGSVVVCLETCCDFSGGIIKM
ncbi:MAG: GH36 C-terminal domain-containing protein [Blautia sp.]